MVETPVPEKIRAAIADAMLARASSQAQAWESGNADEDVITGDFLGGLRCDWTPVTIGGDSWDYRITYYKFQGRGDGSLESPSGSDGVIEFEMRLPGSREIWSKGLLFQAKKNWHGSDPRLLAQVRRMSGLLKDAYVFSYSEEGFEALPADAVISAKGDRKRIRVPSIEITDLLAREFVPCRIGLIGFHFDARRRQLVVPDANGRMRIYEHETKHRLRVQILGPEEAHARRRMRKPDRDFDDE